MKNHIFLVFFGIIFTIHFLVNYYIYSRGVHGLEGYPTIQIIFRYLMLLLLLAYPMGRFLERVWYNPFSTTLHWIGAFWFAGMLYAILALIALDVLRAVNHFIPFFPNQWAANYQHTKFIATITIASLVVITVIIGHINAWNTRTFSKTIDINKKSESTKKLKIVAVSDIHLGTIIGPRKTQKLINKINALNPDIVLIAGDLVDEDLKPVIEQDLGKNFLNLKSKYGTYAIMGNHEYIGGVESATEYLKSHNINVLRDSTILVDSAFYIVGREDKDILRFTGKKRKEVSELMNGVDKTKPIIVLDHQPFDLESASKNSADIQISGHTHHGQLWPFNYITSAIFELSAGYKLKENCHTFVSTGYGTWGPPVRLGNRPEILEIDVLLK